MGLDNYEASYQWFLQRAYQFNSLSSAGLTMTPQLNRNALQVQSTAAALTSNSTVLFDVLASSITPVSDVRGPVTQSISPNDYYLHYSDYDLINKTRAEHLINIARNRTTPQSAYFAPSPLGSSRTPLK